MVQNALSALQENDIEALKRLLDQDRRLLTRHLKANQTLLHLACMQSPAVLNLVLRRLSDLFVGLAKKDDGLEFFCLAARYLGAEGALLVAKALNWRQEHYQRQLLSSIQAGDVQVISVCLDLGADVDAVDQEGNTPLHRAILLQRNLRAVVELLLRRDANVKARNQKGKRASDIARDAGRDDIAIFIETQQHALKLAPYLQPLQRQLQLLQQMIMLNATAVESFSQSKHEQPKTKTEMELEQIEGLSDEQIANLSFSGFMRYLREVRRMDRPEELVEKSLYVPGYRNYLRQRSEKERVEKERKEREKQDSQKAQSAELELEQLRSLSDLEVVNTVGFNAWYWQLYPTDTTSAEDRRGFVEQYRNYLRSAVDARKRSEKERVEKERKEREKQDSQKAQSAELELEQLRSLSDTEVIRAPGFMAWFQKQYPNDTNLQEDRGWAVRIYRQELQKAVDAHKCPEEDGIEKESEEQYKEKQTDQMALLLQQFMMLQEQMSKVTSSQAFNQPPPLVNLAAQAVGHQDSCPHSSKSLQRHPWIMPMKDGIPMMIYTPY